MNLIETNLTFVPIAIVLFTLVAVFTDLKSRQIPNWLTVSAFVAALVFHLATGGWTALLHSLGGFATGFGILLVLWLIGGGGGGDVKLMGAIGAWVGVMPTLMIFLGSVFAALFCIGLMIVFQMTVPQKAVAAEPGAQPAKNSMVGKSIPYAVPASIATWVVVLLQFV